MQIVIDIPEIMYGAIKEYGITFLSRDDKKTLRKSIVNGTPLPEHHGRLIDVDAFQQYCFNKNFDKRLSDGGLATINMFLEFQPTIIDGE